jgi:hypothetical protein
MTNVIKSPLQNANLMHLRVDGTGTAQLLGMSANKFALTDNGTGDYTLTAPAAFSQPPAVSVMPVTANVNVYLKAEPTTTVLRFQCTAQEKTAVLSLNGIKFHSLLQGADGNDITIAITAGATAGSEVITSTSAGAITIQVETGVSTATQVYAALKALDSGVVSAFVGYELITGATTWATAAAAPLAGGVTAAAVDAEFDVLIFADIGE